MKNFKKYSKWINYSKNTKNKYPNVLESMKKQKKFINSYYFVNVLSVRLNKNDVIITDMGFECL